MDETLRILLKHLVGCACDGVGLPLLDIHMLTVHEAQVARLREYAMQDSTWAQRQWDERHAPV